MAALTPMDVTPAIPAGTTHYSNIIDRVCPYGFNVVCLNLIFDYFVGVAVKQFINNDSILLVQYFQTS